jgi:hypothetical protein
MKRVSRTALFAVVAMLAVVALGCTPPSPGGDTAKPVLHLPGDFSVEATSSAGATVTFEATAVDLVSGSVPVTCNPASASVFAIGSTTVTCSASDAAGNTATGGFSVSVVDTTPPVLFLPADLTAINPGPPGVNVSYTVTATDKVDGTVPVTCSASSGTLFPVGTTVVNCSAGDTAGNTASGTFTVTVVDTTAPVLALPGGVTVEATGPTGAAVSYTTSAFDTVEGDRPVTCSAGSGSVFALGITTVTCYASDLAGNTVVGPFDVTVVDTTAPTLTLPSDITASATSAAGAAVSYSVGATDAVNGTVPVTCEPTSGSGFPVGESTVNCSSVDAAGNVASGSFTVTVTKWEGPLIVAVGNGTIRTSPDGVRWTQQATGLGLLNAVAFNGSMWVAVGNSGRVYTSPDGGNWTARVSPTTEPLFDVTWGNPSGLPWGSGIWVATGFDGTIIYSPDGVNWTDAGFTQIVNLDTVAWNGTIFAAPSAQGTGPATSPDGITWTPNGGWPKLTGLVWMGTQWVFVGNDSVVLSPDAVQISNTVSTPSGGLIRVGWNGAQLVAVGDNGVIATSTDAVNWQGATSGTTQDLRRIVWDGGQWIASGYGGTVLTSPDGFTWTPQDTGTTVNLLGLAVGTGDEPTSSLPTLVLPVDITAEATGPDGATVTYTATATDLVDGTVPVSCTPVSGSVFAPGVTTATCSATDSDGNTAQGSFRVTVHPWVPPPTGPCAASGLVITEVDYDQVGVDSAEFVEICNGTNGPVALDDLSLRFINGAASNEYLRVGLRPAGEVLQPGSRLVVASEFVGVPAGVPVIRFPGGTGSDYIQNGAPDGVVLVDDATEEVIDGLSYEGAISSANLTGFSLPVAVTEGTALPGSVADSNTVSGSLVRPNGVDTNDNAADWEFSTTPTPGTPNTPIPALARLASDATVITVGASADFLTVSLDQAAEVGGTLVSLSSIGPVTVPPSVTVPAGQSSARVTVTAFNAGFATVTASLGGLTRTVTLDVIDP